MSRIFDILQRQRVDGRPSTSPSPDTQVPPARTESSHGRAVAWRSTPYAQLPNVPVRWAIEVQRIALLLTATADGQDRPINITFSSLRRRSGTTTISYLVAHYLATERANKKVLYVNFSSGEGTSPDGAAVVVGQDVPTPPAPNEKVLNRMSIRPGRDRSPAVTSMWFRDLMDEARKAYDIIIVDSPPFAAAPETYSLAKAGGGVVLILRCGEVRYSAVNALVADLEQLGISIVGVVLNYRQYPIPKWLLKIL